jgi:succinoglycan biosynthesis protein ExoM
VAATGQGGDELVAVCVCSGGGRETLLPCLRSVLAQEVPPGARVTTVVVDNSRDGEVARAVEGLGPGLLCVDERKPGIPAARNRAVEIAVELEADWIAFIDDDEIAPAGWLVRLLELAKANGADALQGGLIFADSQEEAARVAGAWSPLADPQVRPRAAAATNNVLLKTRLVKPPLNLRFDEAMTKGGSDGEFFMRAAAAGCRIMRTEDAPVVEYRPVERQSLAYAARRSFRTGANANYRYRKNYGAVDAAARLLLRALERLLRGLARIFAAILVLLFARSKSTALARKGLSDLSFAFGCLGPYFGAAPAKYH